MDNQQNTVQKFTTLLGFSLPLIQFFYGLLTPKVASIFLFRDYFLIVSVFTAVVAYILVLVIKASPNFDWYPFQKRRVRAHKEWNTKTNRNLFEISDVAAYIKDNKFPKELRLISSGNISQKVFLPFIMSCFLAFFLLGLIYQNTVVSPPSTIQALILTAQALSYTLFVTFVVLAFALQYIRDTNDKAFRDGKRAQFSSVLELARKQNAFGEYQDSSMLGYKVLRDDEGLPTHHAYIIKVGNKHFIVASDLVVDTIEIVNEYSTLEEARNAFWGAQE